MRKMDVENIIREEGFDKDKTVLVWLRSGALRVDTGTIFFRGDYIEHIDDMGTKYYIPYESVESIEIGDDYEE